MSGLSHEELHARAIPKLAFWRSLQQLMVSVGVTDYGLRDFNAPASWGNTPNDATKRCISNLSALINFLKFREDKEVVYEEQREESRKLGEEKLELHSEVSTTRAHVEQLKQQGLDAQGAADGVLEDAANLRQTRNELNQQQVTLNEEIKEQKLQVNELNDAVSNSRFEIMAARQKVNKLKTQVVSSPEKRKAQMRDKENDLDATKEQAATSDRRLKDLQLRKDGVAKVEKDVTKSIALMGELEAEIEKYKAEKHKLKECKALIEKCEEDLRNLGNQEQTLRRKQKVTKENSQRAKREFDAALHDIQGRLRQSTAEKAQAEEERSGLQKQADLTEAHSHEMREALQKFRTDNKKEIDAMAHLCSRLENKVDEYHETLAARMQVASV